MLGGFLGVDAGHLDENAVGALAGDQRLGGAHRVEAFFNDDDGLIHLLFGDRHHAAVVGFPRLDAQREGGAAEDVDAAFEALLAAGTRP